MEKTSQLSRHFFAQDTVTVARELLGKKLIRLEDDRCIVGTITETEAYRGEEDLACHARAGQTSRTEVMYGPPGHAYIYFNYGIHWLLNFVTEKEGYPAAVLIRAMVPMKGLDIIARRRKGRPPSEWTDGPAKICQALNLDKKFNGIDLCAPQAILFVEEGKPLPDAIVTASRRVGLNNVPEPWRSIPWRFKVKQKK